MSKDIVQRLHELSLEADYSSRADANLLVQAADEIERLRGLLEEKKPCG